MITRFIRTAALVTCFAAANVASVCAQQATTAEIFGIENGIYEEGQFLSSDPAVIAPLLVPAQNLRTNGTGSTTMISQLGTGNFASAGIIGSNSAAAITQSGSNNRAVQAIQGSDSAMLLVQSGEGNSVVQTSIGHDNTQLLGVSGTNNDVAFVQVGDHLGGAMSVGGQDSAVVALQTGNNNYMMPSGINGLKNQVVVIVPGRMYVFNKPN
jgi:hypothetical protein